MRRVLLLLALALPLGASGASFDCARAGTATERLICADERVSDLDNDLADAYTRALRGPDGDGVRKAQQEWIAHARAACKDAACLRQAYVDRIAAIIAHEVTTADACATVTSYANAGALDALLLPHAEVPPALHAWLAGRKDGLSEADQYWSVDLDADGTKDVIVRAIEGTMRVSSVAVIPGRPGAAPVAFDVPAALDVDPVAVHGHVYLLAGDGSRLTGLYAFNGSRFQQACEFRVRKEDRVDLSAGRAEPVCQAALAGQLETVPFTTPHLLGQLPPEERFASLSPLPGAATVDLDGDGRPESVLHLDYSFGGGRGCDATYLAVLNGQLNAVPDSPLNRTLLAELGGFPCGPTLDLVRQRGHVYVEAQRKHGGHALYRIRQDKAELVCRIHRTLQYYVGPTGKVAAPVAAHGAGH